MSQGQFDDHWLESVAQAFGWDRGPGLTEVEIVRIETTSELHIPDDLRALMQYATPEQQGALDWHQPNVVDLFMGDVADGIWWQFEVKNRWTRELGSRPPDTSPKSRRYFDELMANVPKLVPIYGQACMPSKPRNSGNPVLSVDPTGVRCIGADLWSWSESKKTQGFDMVEPTKRVPFWGPAFLEEL